jgi:hypothetical protein
MSTSGMQRGMEFRSLATSCCQFWHPRTRSVHWSVYFERRYLLMYDLLFRNPGFLSQKRGFLRDSFINLPARRSRLGERALFHTLTADECRAPCGTIGSIYLFTRRNFQVERQAS